MKYVLRLAVNVLLLDVGYSMVSQKRKVIEMQEMRIFNIQLL